MSMHLARLDRSPISKDPTEEKVEEQPDDPRPDKSSHVSSPSKHRPNPYPPNASWAGESPRCIPICEPSDPKIAVQRSSRSPSRTVQPYTISNAGGTKQLTLFQTLEKDKAKLTLVDEVHNSNSALPSVEDLSFLE
jgi:hypothetical protein